MSGLSTAHAPALPAPLAHRARQTALDLSDRMSTPERVAALADRSMGQSEEAAWDGVSFSHGHGGVALLHLYAARAGAPVTERAFEFLRAAVAQTHIDPLPEPGVFGGTSGLALVMADCCATEPRFGPSLDRLHERLAGQVLRARWPMGEKAVTDYEYDAISGASGVLAYLCSIERPGDLTRAAIDRAVSFLVGRAGGDGRYPRGLVLRPDSYPPVEEYHRDYPYGYLNVGLSHGIPGITAALAAAWRVGHRDPGLRPALDRLTGWLVDIAGADEHGTVWPHGVALSEDGAQLPDSHQHDRLAWCYGTAGVAVALLSTAEATGDEALRATAVDAFEAVLRRGPSREWVLSPTLCHGFAGLVAICDEFASAGGSAAAAAALPDLVEELLSYADPARPLLFADEEVPGRFVDDPGLLTGACGVGLTLLAAAAEQRPAWYRAFFLR